MNDQEATAREREKKRNNISFRTVARPQPAPHLLAVVVAVGGVLVLVVVVAVGVIVATGPVLARMRVAPLVLVGVLLRLLLLGRLLPSLFRLLK